MTDADILTRAAEDFGVVNMGYGYENQPVFRDETREVMGRIGYDQRWAGVSHRIELPLVGPFATNIRIRNPLLTYQIKKTVKERQTVIDGMLKFYDFAVSCFKEHPELAHDPDRDGIVDTLWQNRLKGIISSAEETISASDGF
jgi:hypothetical protein